MKIIEVLEKIECAARGNMRLATIDANDSPTLRRILYHALSPDVTFGMKKIPEPAKPFEPKYTDDQWLDALFALLSGMMEDDTGHRILSGNDAKAEVAKFLGRCTDDQRKWAERIILQDLRLSVGAKDINMLFGPNTIPLFAIPLAKPFKDLKSLKGKWMLQQKMDGGRVVSRITAKDGSVRLLSRTGKEWPGFHDIKADVKQWVDGLNLSMDTTIDGEIVVYKSGRMDFQAMQKMFHSSDDRKPDGEMVYVLFDLATTKEYDEPATAYENRLYNLKEMVRLHPLPPSMRVIESVVVQDPTKEKLDAVAHDYVLKHGCDGAIIRRADCPPTNKKTSDITKVKPFEDGEAVVLDRVEGKGHLEGSLGTLVCQLIVKGKKVGSEFEIGTGEGLTKDLRQELWDDLDLIGKIVNFKYQRLSDDGVPVLPTYRAIRHPNDVG